MDSSLVSGKIRASVFAWAVTAVQLRFFLCMWFRQNLGVSSLRRSLWWSAGCSDPETFCWCCGTLSLPCQSLWPLSLWALGRGFLFFILCFFPPLAGSFLRPFLDSCCDWCSLCSISTGCCLNGSVLCSSSSQLSFTFPVNVCWGPGGVISLGPLRVFIRLLRLFCSFLSTFVFSSCLCLTFSMTAESHFSVGLDLRAAVFSFASLSCSRSFCLSYPKALFLFQGA